MLRIQQFVHTYAHSRTHRLTLELAVRHARVVVVVVTVHTYINYKYYIQFSSSIALHCVVWIDAIKSKTSQHRGIEGNGYGCRDLWLFKCQCAYHSYQMLFAICNFRFQHLIQSEQYCRYHRLTTTTVNANPSQARHTYTHMHSTSWYTWKYNTEESVIGIKPFTHEICSCHVGFDIVNLRECSI